MQKLSNNKRLLSVVGPTAIGKTGLAIELAEHIGTEIISCDSRQFYQEMRIGTAVPTAEEQARVPHHFIQNLSIDTDYSVGDFERDAIAFLTNYYRKADCCVMVGGSGLYEKAVGSGLDEFPTIDPAIRAQLNAELEQDGLVLLQEELLRVDPTYYAEVNLLNPQRVTRALEVFRGSGKPFSSFRNQKAANRPFKTLKIGLELPREEMYARINHRVDLMMEEGLLEEAKALYPLRHLNALQTVGYRELFAHFDGEISLEFALEEIKKNTRRFAKRQMTWFKKDVDVQWFSATEVDQIKAYCDTYLNS